MIRNYNILRFHTDQNKLYSNREFIGTKLGKILAEQRSIPPFQIIRPTLTNSPITSFNLINQADGTSTSYLTEALATCLSIQESANNSNYAETGLTPHDIPISSQSSAWGFSITASISSLRHAVVTAYCNDFDNIPSKFTARILDSKGGTQLLESTEVKKVPPFKTNFKVYFDFGQVYDNTTPYNLYLEVKADGVWKPVGNDALYSGETVSYRNDAGANYDTTGYPDTDQIIITDGSAYVETYEYGGNFDVIVNDGSDIGVYIPTGVYSIEMSDGRYTWYSEPFKVVNYINDFLKIQYWHNEPFPLPLGNMRYFDGYKNQLLLDAKIRQPEYEEEENVEERLGIELPISRTSKKVMKFMFYATEYMLDAIRLIWLHHNITIETDCELYTVDEFNISNVDWDREGLFGEVTIEFTTQTVVTTTGHNRSDNNYIEQEVLDLMFPTLTECLDCIEFDYEAEDLILAINEGVYNPSPNYSKYVISNEEVSNPSSWNFSNDEWEIGDTLGGGTTGQRFGLNSSKFNNVSIVIFYKIGQNAGMPDASAFVADLNVGDEFILANPGSESNVNSEYGIYRIDAITRDDVVGEETYPEKRMEVTYLSGGTESIDFYDIAMSNIGDVRGQTTSELALKYWNGSSFSNVALEDGEVVKYGDTFYFRSAVGGAPAKYKELLTQTVIDAVTNLGGNARRIDGVTFNTALVKVEATVVDDLVEDTSCIDQSNPIFINIRTTYNDYWSILTGNANDLTTITEIRINSEGLISGLNTYWDGSIEDAAFITISNDSEECSNFACYSVDSYVYNYATPNYYEVQLTHLYGSGSLDTSGTPNILMDYNLKKEYNFENAVFVENDYLEVVWRTDVSTTASSSNQEIFLYIEETLVSSGEDATVFLDSLSQGDKIFITNPSFTKYAVFEFISATSLNDRRYVSVRYDHVSDGFNIFGLIEDTLYIKKGLLTVTSTEFSPCYDGKELNDNGIVMDVADVTQFRVHAFGKDCTFTTSDWIANV